MQFIVAYSLNGQLIIYTLLVLSFFIVHLPRPMREKNHSLSADKTYIDLYLF